MGKDNIKHHTQWYVWWGYSILLDIIGGFFIGAGYASREAGVFLFLFVIAICCFVGSFTLFIIAIQSLITEAHVKALEVFHGKKRCVEPTLESETNAKKQQTNGYEYWD